MLSLATINQIKHANGDKNSSQEIITLNAQMLNEEKILKSDHYTGREMNFFMITEGGDR